MEMESNLELYKRFDSRIRAQIWDSPANFYDFQNNKLDRLASLFFPGLKWLHGICIVLMNCFWYAFYFMSAGVYLRSLKTFDNNPIKKPALILFSKADKIVSEKSIFILAFYWKYNGIDVHLKRFENSAHVKHYLKYDEEYVSAVHDHLSRNGLLRYPERMGRL